MDIKKIETILEDNVNKRKFYNSKIDFGLITYNFTTLIISNFNYLILYTLTRVLLEYSL